MICIALLQLGLLALPIVSGYKYYDTSNQSKLLTEQQTEAEYASQIETLDGEASSGKELVTFTQLGAKRKMLSPTLS